VANVCTVAFMGHARNAVRRRRVRRRASRIDGHTPRVLTAAGAEGASVLVLGLEELGDECWAVLAAAGVQVMRVADVGSAVDALSDRAAQVVIAEAAHGRALTAAIRRRRDLAAAHIVLCAALDSPRELRDALDAGADDVMRVPFEPEVLAARVAAGLSPRACARKRRYCGRWSPTSPGLSTAARATSTGRWSG
jgi:DNA-binding response OmpR family regulator